MKKLICLLAKSKYHIFIVTLYFFVCSHFFIFTPRPFAYYLLHAHDVVTLFGLGFFALISFFIVNQFVHFGDVVLQRKDISDILLIIFYASVVIALPEEIIFRWYIQTSIQSVIPSIGIVIVLSAIIFGLAHALNGSYNFLPSGWNWKLVTMTFVAGLYLGVAYFLTNSLLVPTMLHAFFVILLKLLVKERSIL